jgi:hypothetical protein
VPEREYHMDTCKREAGYFFVAHPVVFGTGYTALYLTSAKTIRNVFGEKKTSLRLWWFIQGHGSTCLFLGNPGVPVRSTALCLKCLMCLRAYKQFLTRYKIL